MKYLEFARRQFRISNTDDNTANSQRRLIAQLTLKDGRVCYERSAG